MAEAKTEQPTTPVPEAPAPAPADPVAEAVKLLEGAEPKVPAEAAAPAEGEPEVPEGEKSEAEPPADEKLAAAYAELARRDRAMRAREASWKQQVREVEQLKASLKTLKDDPINTMLQLGVDLPQLLADVGREDTQQRTKREDPELAELKKWKAEVEAERQRSRVDQTIRAELDKIRSIAQADPDANEAVLSHADGPQRVFATLDAYYKQTGLMPSDEDYREAVRVVEVAYRQEEQEQLESLAKAKRHQGRVQMVAASTQSPAKAAATRAPTKTLSQEQQRESPPRPTPRTEEERLAEAIRIANELDFKL